MSEQQRLEGVFAPRASGQWAKGSIRAGMVVQRTAAGIWVPVVGDFQPLNWQWDDELKTLSVQLITGGSRATRVTNGSSLALPVAGHREVSGSLEDLVLVVPYSPEPADGGTRTRAEADAAAERAPLSPREAPGLVVIDARRPDTGLVMTPGGLAPLGSLLTSGLPASSEYSPSGQRGQIPGAMRHRALFSSFGSEQPGSKAQEWSAPLAIGSGWLPNDMVIACTGAMFPMRLPGNLMGSLADTVSASEKQLNPYTDGWVLSPVVFVPRKEIMGEEAATVGSKPKPPPPPPPKPPQPPPWPPLPPADPRFPHGNDFGGQDGEPLRGGVRGAGGAMDDAEIVVDINWWQRELDRVNPPKIPTDPLAERKRKAAEEAAAALARLRAREAAAAAAGKIGQKLGRDLLAKVRAWTSGWGKVEPRLEDPPGPGAPKGTAGKASPQGRAVFGGEDRDPSGDPITAGAGGWQPLEPASDDDFGDETPGEGHTGYEFGTDPQPDGPKVGVARGGGAVSCPKAKDPGGTRTRQLGGDDGLERAQQEVADQAPPSAPSHEGLLASIVGGNVLATAEEGSDVQEWIGAPLGGAQGDPRLAWVSDDRGRLYTVHVPAPGDLTTPAEVAGMVNAAKDGLMQRVPPPGEPGAASSVWGFLGQVQKSVSSIQEALDGLLVGDRVSRWGGNIAAIASNALGVGVAENWLGVHHTDLRDDENHAAGLNVLQSLVQNNGPTLAPNRPALRVMAHVYGLIANAMPVLRLEKQQLNGATHTGDWLASGPKSDPDVRLLDGGHAKLNGALVLADHATDPTPVALDTFPRIVANGAALNFTSSLGATVNLAVDVGWAWGATRQTLSGNLVLTNASNPAQSIDPDGSDWTVTLPAVAAATHPFWIANVAETGGVLTILEPAGGLAVATLSDRTGCWAVADGTEWLVHSFTLPVASATAENYEFGGTTPMTASHLFHGQVVGYGDLDAAADWDSQHEVVRAGTVDLCAFHTSVVAGTSTWKIWRNGAAVETLPTINLGSGYVAAGTAVVAGDELGLEFDAGTAPGAGAVRLRVSHSGALGWSLTWGGVWGEGAGPTYAVCDAPAADADGIADASLTQDSEYTIPDDCDAETLAWMTAGGTTQQTKLYVNGAAAVTVALTGTQGTAACVSALTAGDEVGLWLAEDATPASVLLTLALSGFPATENAGMAYPFRGNASGAGQYYGSYGYMLGGGGSSASLDYSTEAVVLRAQAADRLAWNSASGAGGTSTVKLWKNGASAESVTRTAAATGVVDAGGTSFLLGDELAVEHDAGTNPGSTNYLVVLR